MTAPYDQKQRIEILERRLSAVEREIQTEQTGNVSAFPRETFLVRTTSLGTAYPTSEESTKYPIMFVDGTFTETPGPGAATTTDHSAAYQAIGYSLCNYFIEDNTLCFAWRQNNRWWILPCARQGTVDMAVLRTCTDETNECCLFDGLAYTLSDIGSGCNPDRCVKKVWITCQNLSLDPNETYAFADAYGNTLPDWCDWGLNTGLTVTCDGEEREVYAIRCPCPGCECPDVNDTVYAKWVHDDLNCGLPDFEMKCVPEDPISGQVPGLNEIFFWGEFSVTGWYPKMGMSHPLEDGHSITRDSITIDAVLCVFVPNGDNPCASGQIEFWGDFNGDHILLDPSEVYLDPSGALGTWEQILANPAPDNCVTWMQRTYYYGMWCACTAGSGNLYTVRIYHLPADSVGGSRALVACDDEDVLVPDGWDYYSNYDTPSDQRVPSLCCEMNPYQVFQSADMVFGTVVPTSFCSTIAMGDQNALSRNYPQMHWHVLGGCKDVYASAHSASMEVCDGNASHGPALLAFSWRNREEECETA